jgi:hypothetical protein
MAAIMNPRLLPQEPLLFSIQISSLASIFFHTIQSVFACDENIVDRILHFKAAVKHRCHKQLRKKQLQNYIKDATITNNKNEPKQRMDI